MSVMDWVGTIGAIWLAVSILLGIAWALGGKRIFRQPPQPPRIVRTDGEPMSQNEANAVRKIIELDAELRGRKGGA